ncbi:Scn11a, partial [Symbiodinium sp. CCMP2456]
LMVVLLDAYCTCRDIDARAATGVEAEDVFTLLSDICLVLYSVELCGLLFVRGWEILKDWFIVLDILVVICGCVEFILVQVTPSELVQKMSLLRALRLARIFRLMRLLRKIRALRELYKLVTMMSTCLKTLLWSFLFCFIVMTVWAMLIVEVVNPIVVQMDSDGAFDDCSNGFCTVSTSSVLHANLLLFQTVIAGDGWGEMATPIILKHPETAIIFIGSLLTLVFGVLNLIVAVVVDTFAEARQHDILNLAEELEDDLEKDTKFLQKLFQRIDRDGSGRVTLDELIEGARKDPEFQSRLRVMDIDEVDLEQLFQMIDVNGSGSIEASDFIWPLSRW